jgi:hypothetical protein
MLVYLHGSFEDSYQSLNLALEQHLIEFTISLALDGLQHQAQWSLASNAAA